MIHTLETAERIVEIARTYLGRPYDYKTFDCVHFIVGVYREVGIVIPRFGGQGHPPSDFNLTPEELAERPLGSTIFLRRKDYNGSRVWTHMVLIASQTHFIHCSRFFGHLVLLTPIETVLEYYHHVPKFESST
jgi:hypothetical protein